MSLENPAIKFVDKRYQLHEKIGSGGMGTVYRATDRLTGTVVALKHVQVPIKDLQFSSLGSGSDTHAHLLALVREFRILAGLRHPHIISVLDYGIDAQQQPYFTMQFIENAITFIQFGAAQDVTDRVHLLTAMLQALTYLHRREIIHRDLKPANVLVTSDGIVKVMDFGLALHQSQLDSIQAGMVGTLAYMAPELMLEKPATIASDLYAVGVMAYELFVGQHPFDRTSVASLVNSVIKNNPDVSMLDDRLASVVERLLMKDPTDRYNDAEAVINALCDATAQPVPEEAHLLRDSFLQAAEFVGREAELAPLMETINIITDSSAQSASVNGDNSQKAILVGGESGIGKSRFLDELRTQALVKGALVLRGQAIEGGGLPYQLWRDVMRRLILSVVVNDFEASVLKTIIPDIAVLLDRHVPDAPELDGQAQQQRLTLTIGDVFKRSDQPIVLLVEDLQWTSESLEPLKLLIREVGTMRCLIVGSYRDDEAPDLPNLLPEMQLVKLGRLGETAITRLSASMLGVAGKEPQIIALLQRETEGNAFFMVEVVRALAEEAGRLANVGRMPLPTTVFAGGMQQIIRRRLQRVPAWAQPLLKLAAIVGRLIDIPVLHHAFAYLHGPESTRVEIETWLTACVNAAVLEIQDTQWRFAHDKLRETLLHDIPPDERPSLHNSIAAAIETIYPERDAYAEALVNHWYNAGNIAKTVHYTLIAAERLVRIMAEYNRAQALLLQAVKLVENQPELHLYRPKLMLLLGDVAQQTSDYEQAIAYYEKALALTEIDDVTKVRCLNGLSRVHWQQSTYKAAKDAAQRGLEIARIGQDKRGMALSLNNLGVIASYGMGDYPAGHNYYQESLRIRRELDDQWGIAVSLNNLGLVAHDEGNYAAAHAFYQESLQVARKIGDRQGMALTLNNLGSLAHDEVDYTAARAYYAESMQIENEIGDRWGIALTLNNLGNIAREQNQFDDARDFYSRSLVLAREIGDQWGVATCLSNLGAVALQEGAVTDAQDYLQQSLVVFRESDNRSFIGLVLGNLVFAEAMMNNVTQARQYLHEGLKIVQEQGVLPKVLRMLVAAARWLMLQGAVERAMSLAAFVQNHPATDGETRNIWLSLLQNAISKQTDLQLSPSIVKDESLDIDKVVEQLIVELDELSSSHGL